jgi:hypothetical protein
VEHQLLKEKLIKFLSELSANILFDLIEDIYQLKIQLNEIELNKNKDEQLRINENNIEIFQSLFTNIKQKRKSLEKLTIYGQNNFTQQTNDKSVLSYLFLKQRSSDFIEPENETNQNSEEHMIEINDSGIIPKISQKIRLSNNTVSIMKGPLRVMVDGTIHAIEVCAKETNENSNFIQAVKQGLEKQNKDNSLNKVFTQITSDWILQGENPDKGFSSTSIWMRNPQDQRILVKIQDLPICAANEWIAYILGKYLGLPVNQVQIAIYKNNLVTLHNDVSNKNEKIISFVDLPKYIQKILLKSPIIEQMDLFDRIIQNVDIQQIF